MNEKYYPKASLQMMQVVENLNFNIRVRDKRIKELEKELKELKQTDEINEFQLVHTETA